VSAIVVTGDGVMCPVADSRAALAGSSPDAPADAPDPVGDWFDPVVRLGRRGWRYQTPATRYLLAAAGAALAEAGLDPALLPPDSTGVAVGTNFAAKPVVGRLDDMVRAEGAEWLSPAEAPNFSVNMAASHVSMKYAMRAFNLTLTDPVVAGLAAVLTLTTAIRRGRAVRGIAGATEERPDDPAASEGACCLVLETADHAAARGASARAAIAGGFSRFLPPGADPGVLDRPLARLLSGGGGGPVPYAVVGDHDLGKRIDDAVATRAPAGLLRRRYPGGDGRYATASPLLAAVGLSTEYGQGLVLATSPHGHVAALRLTSMGRTRG
jgi:hypothetical protein